MDYGQIGKSFTVCCAACGNETTFSERTVIAGRPRIYLATAKKKFRTLEGWSTRDGYWLCHGCTLDYDGKYSEWDQKNVKNAIRENIQHS